MFEKVSRSLKYDSNIFFDHRHIYIYIYMDTTVDHFTPLVLRVRGNNNFPLILCCSLVNNNFPLHLSVALIINRDREVVNMGMVYANVLVTFT